MNEKMDKLSDTLLQSIGIISIIIALTVFVFIIAQAFAFPAAAALPPNTTDWNWGNAYPEGSYDENGYPCDCDDYELTDDNLNETEEIEDEEIHEIESEEYDNND